VSAKAAAVLMTIAIGTTGRRRIRPFQRRGSAAAYAHYNPCVIQDVSPDWVKDDLGERFVKAALHFRDDYDGRVTATVVRNRSLVSQPSGAVLYLHGF
jgi:hypothetical protein